MSSFLELLFDPEVDFLRNAFLLGLIGSIPLGVVGSFVVVRRISYLAAAIAHSALGGIGLSLFVRSQLGWDWLPPFLGALIFTVASALLVGWLASRKGQREDAAIGTVWVAGMAIGIIAINLTPGYNDPMAYLFGDILLLRPTDLWLAGGFAFFIVGLLVLAHRQLFSVLFDPEFAASRGLRVDPVYLLLLVLTALTVVTLVSLVGVVLVVALLTLPPAIALARVRRFRTVILVSILLNMACIALGLWLGYVLDAPAGPTIILVAAAAYVLGFLPGLKRRA
ncbi:MAG: metal ABC transporter permease [Opitutales bacterium]